MIRFEDYFVDETPWTADRFQRKMSNLFGSASSEEEHLQNILKHYLDADGELDSELLAEHGYQAELQIGNTENIAALNVAGGTPWKETYMYKINEAYRGEEMARRRVHTSPLATRTVRLPLPASSTPEQEETNQGKGKGRAETQEESLGSATSILERKHNTDQDMNESPFLVKHASKRRKFEKSNVQQTPPSVAESSQPSPYALTSAEGSVPEPDAAFKSGRQASQDKAETTSSASTSSTQTVMLNKIDFARGVIPPDIATKASVTRGQVYEIVTNAFEVKFIHAKHYGALQDKARHCLAQEILYLSLGQEICGLWLGGCFVNSLFTRVCALDQRTFLVELATSECSPVLDEQVQKAYGSNSMTLMLELLQQSPALSAEDLLQDPGLAGNYAWDFRSTPETFPRPSGPSVFKLSSEAWTVMEQLKETSRKLALRMPIDRALSRGLLDVDDRVLPLKAKATLKTDRETKLAISIAKSTAMKPYASSAPSSEAKWIPPKFRAKDSAVETTIDSSHIDREDHEGPSGGGGVGGQGPGGRGPDSDTSKHGPKDPPKENQQDDKSNQGGGSASESRKAAGNETTGAEDETPAMDALGFSGLLASVTAPSTPSLTSTQSSFRLDTPASRLISTFPDLGVPPPDPFAKAVGAPTFQNLQEEQQDDEVGLAPDDSVSESGLPDQEEQEEYELIVKLLSALEAKVRIVPPSVMSAFIAVRAEHSGVSADI